jgi:nitric oxide reductase NorQ protein
VEAAAEARRGTRREAVAYRDWRHRPSRARGSGGSATNVRSGQAGDLTTTEQSHGFKQMQVEDFRITEEPFYLPISDEVELFETAYAQKVPVLLKGPTGSGKTRFVEYMSWRLHRHIGDVDAEGVPLITVACHEDLTASDLVGRYLLEGDDTRWIDGPLTRAVKVGAICYLDEIVEARKDTTVLIHPLTDYRRLLPIDKRGELLEAADGFLLVMSYNPGYQSALKDLKHSTRQRFIAIEFDYPPRDQEAEIIHRESGVDRAVAQELAKLAEKVRNLKEHGLAEGVSTRLLVYVGKLITQGINPRRACQTGIVWALTDDLEVQRSIEEVVTSIFDE